MSLRTKQGNGKSYSQNGVAQSETLTNPSGSAKGKPVCYNCMKVNHIWRNCPNRKKVEETQGTEARVEVMRTGGQEDTPLLLIDVEQLITK